MDATTKQMLDRLSELERKIGMLNSQANSIRTALELVGVRPSDDNPLDESVDSRYAATVPFYQTTLVEACKRILMDYKGKWLSKTQIEYLAAMGGYQFSTDDSKNSVDVTLRRLTERGFCEVQRNRGPQGNTYRWIEERDS